MLSMPEESLVFKCSCREGFKGLTCQKRIEPCADEPCANGGSCVPNGEHYHCVCTDGYEGKNCDTAKKAGETCGDKPCGDNGVCEMVNADFICECYPGYEGPRCETAVAENKPEPIVVAAKTEEEEEREEEQEKTEWDIRNMLITLSVVIFFVLLVLLFLCIHCSRVYKRRSEAQSLRSQRKAAGMVAPKVPGWVETSNKLCNDFFCYLCSAPKKDKQPELDELMYGIDPDQYYIDPGYGDEFYAYEDPGDVLYQADVGSPNQNANKRRSRENLNRSSSVAPCGRRYQEPPRSHKLLDKTFTYKKRYRPPKLTPPFQITPKPNRSRRGQLEGFKLMTPVQRQGRGPRDAVKYKITPPFSGHRRQKGRLVSARQIGGYSREFPFRPTRPVWRISEKQRRMDDLEFDDDEGDEDDSSSTEGTTRDSSDNDTRRGYDDDGYVSTSKLSESDAGGRGRDPQSMQMYAENASRMYGQGELQKQPAAVWLDPSQEEELNLGGSPAPQGAYMSEPNMYPRRPPPDPRLLNPNTRVKSILKNSNTSRGGAIIHVRPLITPDGRRKPHIFREYNPADPFNPMPAPRQGYVDNSSRGFVPTNQYTSFQPSRPCYDQGSSGCRSPHPPLYPPPVYEHINHG
ncbi:uncharacterized protein LOC131935875 isoform X2 [Physella acuta]|uniref:uncharacterized protein LOC131935875 isoform X2 n=1 Tax=Physella acuta TaxID=109671 RepID=UPI0027DE0F71|nr:uncharacterized protein LOC131935875 isoform X2 [Physella acuta]